MNFLRVLFVTDEMACGGVAAALLELLKSLDTTKFEAHVLVLHHHGEFLDRIPKGIRVFAGTPFFDIIDQKFSVLKRQKDVRGMVRKIVMGVCLKTGMIRPIIRREREKVFGNEAYDVELAYKDGFCTVFTSCGQTQRRIAWVHNDYSIFKGAKNYKALLHRCFESMDAVIAVSQKAADCAEQYFCLSKKPEVIPNLVDETKIRELSTAFEPPFDHTRPCFVSIGRLSFEKGYDRLLSVHARLIREGLPHNIYIVGEGEGRAELEALRSRLGVEGSFFFLGYQPNPYPYIASSDGYIMSSRHEASPVVIPEALLLKTPVISTDVADVKDRVTAGPYGLIADNNENSLYEKIRNTLNNPGSLDIYKYQLADYIYDNNDIIKKINSVLGGMK